MAYIEKEVWMEYLGGMEVIFLKIANSFIESYKDFKSNVLDALENEKKSELYNHIHSLKGITLNMGMVKLYDSCQEALSYLKKDIVDRKSIDDLLVVFENTYSELKGIIS